MESTSNKITLTEVQLENHPTDSPSKIFCLKMYLEQSCPAPRTTTCYVVAEVVKTLLSLELKSQGARTQVSVTIQKLDAQLE